MSSSCPMPQSQDIPGCLGYTLVKISVHTTTTITNCLKVCTLNPCTAKYNKLQVTHPEIQNTLEFRYRDPSRRTEYSLKESELIRQRIKNELPMKPAWKINPISAGYDRLWPLRDVAVTVDIPEDIQFTIPEADDKRNGVKLGATIVNKLGEVTPDMMNDERIELIMKYFRKIFFTEVNHVYKFTPSQLLQMLYLIFNNFRLATKRRKSIYLECSCKLDTQKGRCPVTYAIHYDAQNNVYYMRPTKDTQHIHDFDLSMDRIRSAGYGLPEHEWRDQYKARFQRVSSRINMLSRKARFSIPAGIPEDGQFTIVFTKEMQGKQVVSILKDLVKNTSRPLEVHPSIHKAYEKLFDISDEVYAFSCSQLCQLLQIYQKCLRLEPNSEGHSTVLLCNPTMTRSSVKVNPCRFRWTLTADYIKSQFYLSKLSGEHSHGINDCALKCGVHPSVNRLRSSEVLPSTTHSKRSREVLPYARPKRPIKRIRVKKVEPYSTNLLSRRTRDN
ncbi:unnamed protein product [Ambrosiozyma monospora]|uniref:Unnamed protein product n=1 Tax=Ambrosiozyma monospora TaxID=43982 RepID=A0A9W6Z389_AMBMO|nr:unnamed protein product [Ambrosiozyma monospora]